MMRKIILITMLFVGLLPSFPALAEDDAPVVTRTKNAEIEIIGENRYKAIRLTPEIYNAANSDLSDLLIEDGNGKNVPYFIHSAAESPAADDEDYFIESLEPQFTTESGYRMTIITIEGLKNLRLSDITLHTDSMFKRTARTTPHGVRKELFNLTFDDRSDSDTTIPLNRRISHGEVFTITIDDGDDTPIEIDKITVRYYADEVVFEGAAGEVYTLVFDGGPAAAPVYDIRRYKDEILAGAIDMVTIGEISGTEAESPPPQPPQRDYRPIFNILIVVIALLLGFVIILKLRNRP